MQRAVEGDQQPGHQAGETARPPAAAGTAEGRTRQEVGQDDGAEAEQVLEERQPVRVFAGQDDAEGDEQRIERRALEDRGEAQAARKLEAGHEVGLAVAADEQWRRPEGEGESHAAADRQEQREAGQVRMAAHPGQDSQRKTGARPEAGHGWGEAYG